MRKDSRLLYMDIIIACVQLRQSVGDELFIKVFSVVDSLLELLSGLEHLEAGEHLQLLACRRLLLKDKLAAIRKIKPPARPKKPAVRFPERTKKVNQVREEILKFIRNGHQVRTKDIVNQFNVISHRTILRNLKKLVSQGLVVRLSEDNGGIRYLAS